MRVSYSSLVDCWLFALARGSNFRSSFSPCCCFSLLCSSSFPHLLSLPSPTASSVPTSSPLSSLDDSVPLGAPKPSVLSRLRSTNRAALRDEAVSHQATEAKLKRALEYKQMKKEKQQQQGESTSSSAEGQDKGKL